MSNDRLQLSVMVTGFPAELRRPEFRPGESPFQFAIRHHPQQWDNCVQRLGLSATQAAAVRKGAPISLSADIERQLEAFQNLRLPSHGRTLMGLAELRESVLRPPYQTISTFEIDEILWLRPVGEDQSGIAQKLANDLKVTMLALPAGTPVDLEFVLEQVRGDFWWTLPGGTRLSTPTLFMQIQRVVLHLTSTAGCALYSDNRYSVIYRTSALRSLVAQGVSLSADRRENARLLPPHGFVLSGGNSEAPLCELESQFGGSGERELTPKLWWQFWK